LLEFCLWPRLMGWLPRWKNGGPCRIRTYDQWIKRFMPDLSGLY